MLDQLVDCAVVADRHTFEAPLLAQQILHQPHVGGGRHAIDRVQGHHHAARTRFNRRVVGRQIVLEHACRAHIDGVVVPPTLNGTIQGEVLDAGHDIAGQGRGGALIGLHHYPGDTRDQVGVFAEALGGTAPARVTGDVHHRCESQVDTVGAGLFGGDAAAQANGIHVPAGSQGQADRENGAMAVDNVVREKHRDLQAAAHGSVLHRAVFVAADGVECAADTARSDFLADHLAGHFRADADQAQLADLFIDAHLFQQLGDEHVFGRQRGRRGLSPRGVTGQADDDAQQTHISHWILLRSRSLEAREAHARAAILFWGGIRST